MGSRHFGLDWLRIAAFGLLIVHHVAMVFSPWDWVINTAHRYPALIIPMAFVTPWRLALLFAVSGYASRALFERSGNPVAFASQRAKRLLVPLAFGMAVLVPLEMWVRVMERGYPHGYLHFWTADYWRWGSYYGCVFPSWEHLWFVAYLAAYTAVLTGAILWRRLTLFAAADRLTAWVMVGYRLLWAPALALAAARLAFLFVVPEETSLLMDWNGHAQFVPMFLFGFVLAGPPQLWPALARVWKAAFVTALVAGAAVMAVEVIYTDPAVPPHGIMALDRASRVVMGWSMVLSLFYLADRWLNRDTRWRRPLGEAVFPAYIVHHPTIVLLAWYSLPLGLEPAAEFILLVVGTATSCAAVYLGGRRVGWLRPLIGLAPIARRSAVPSGATAHGTS